MITKKCNQCGEEKSLDGFYKHKDCTHGVMNQCKDCKRSYQKSYANTEEGKNTRKAYLSGDSTKGRRREQAKGYLERGKQFVAQYAKETGQDKCARCGTDEALEWDHIDRKTKSFTIGEGMFRSLEALLVELKKCQRLCKSCHIAKTKESEDWKPTF